MKVLHSGWSSLMKTFRQGKRESGSIRRESGRRDYVRLFMHERGLRFASENGFVLFLASEHLSFKWASPPPLTATTYKISAYLSPKMHVFSLCNGIRRKSESLWHDTCSDLHSKLEMKFILQEFHKKKIYSTWENWRLLIAWYLKSACGRVADNLISLGQV